MYKFREFYIPDRMMPSIERYLDKGIPPGRFLTAIICNDLVSAAAHADDENIKNLPAYAAFFYNNVPSPAWGSKEKMNAWVQNKTAEEEKKRDKENASL